MYELTPDHLESVASNSSIAYGKLYYDGGNVSNIKITNDKFIEATVAGLKKYRVFMELNNGVYKSRCECPYDRDNFCKHKVAVLMALMDETSDLRRIKVSLRKEKYLKLNYRIQNFLAKIKN